MTAVVPDEDRSAQAAWTVPPTAATLGVMAFVLDTGLTRTSGPKIAAVQTAAKHARLATAILEKSMKDAFTDRSPKSFEFPRHRSRQTNRRESMPGERCEPEN
jgi:hypothetical protein